MVKTYNLTKIEPLFRDYLHSENVSDITVRNYMSDIRSFNEWLVSNVAFSVDRGYFSEGVGEIEDILIGLKESHIYLYIDYLKVNVSNFNNINRSLSSLRRYFAFLKGIKYVGDDIMANVHNVSLGQKTAEKVDDTPDCDLVADFEKYLLNSGKIEDYKDCIYDIREFLKFVKNYK